jgi:tRNA (guanosine-2'-O-)-methyltransferase
MGNHWKRWRGYMDELEEAMRMAGAQLQDVERALAEKWQFHSWKTPQREAHEPHLVDKARRIPFFRTLMRAAAELGPDPEIPAPPAEVEAWETTETAVRELSAERGAQFPPSAASDPLEKQPPARLRNAERALAHRTRSLLVVLEELTSPRNALAIVRTADALGLQEVHFIDARGKVILNHATTRMCERWMDLVWHRDPTRAIDELAERGYQVLAADFAEESRAVDSAPLGSKIALVLGNEQEGVSPAVREKADGLLHIPTVGFTSYLNVSVTAGMALYELDRRMRNEGLREPLTEEDAQRLRRSWYSLLAGRSAAKQSEYCKWLGDPPEPSSARKAIPSREKRRQLSRPDAHESSR